MLLSRDGSKVYGRMRKAFFVFWIALQLTGICASATELKPETAASFDRYIRAVEARMDEDLRRNQFLIVDRLPDLRRQQAYDQLQQGQIYIEETHARDDDRPLHQTDRAQRK